MGKERQTETTRTIEQRIEQNAHDIIAACELIMDLCEDESDEADGLPPRHRWYHAARSARFHAEGILASSDGGGP